MTRDDGAYFPLEWMEIQEDILEGGTMTVTEILDRLVDSLVNRNREHDDHEAILWAEWLEMHAEFLRRGGLDDDD